MGTLTYAYKQSVLNEIIYNISSGVSNYYAFASNPIAYSNSSLSIDSSEYELNFINNWQILFGKKLTANNFCPVVNNNIWSSNTVYNRYDNNVENLNNFYIVTPPVVVGADYLVYKCIDNANGSSSTFAPNLIQSNTFYTADNYAWRYMYSISNQNYQNFATSSYIPVIPNNSITVSAANNSGVDVVMIANSGVGYNSYHDGIIQSFGTVNNQYIQISSNASFINYFYNNNAIYMYSAGNNSPTSSQLFLITNYISNSSGNFVYTNGVVNTSSIILGQTNYKISPAVIFSTDGNVDPIAYSIINTTSNSISNVVVISPGVNISWANVKISSNSNFGSGANLYAICPPAGGHGGNPSIELGIQGCSICFNFANSEGNTIPTNIAYNTIGILKNPYILNSDGTSNNNLYTSNVFNNFLTANVSTTFPIYSKVLGAQSGALGVTTFANSTNISIVGDKNFTNGEIITSLNPGGRGVINVNSTINIITNGNIYTKNINSLYVQNINTVTRANNSNESFKLILQI